MAATDGNQLLFYGLGFYKTKPFKYDYYPSKDGNGYIWSCPNCGTKNHAKNKTTARTATSRAARTGHCAQCKIKNNSNED